MLRCFAAHAAHWFSFDFTPATKIRKHGASSLKVRLSNGRIEDDRSGVVSDVGLSDPAIGTGSGNLADIDAQFAGHSSHRRCGRYRFLWCPGLFLSAWPDLWPPS